MSLVPRNRGTVGGWRWRKPDACTVRENPFFLYSNGLYLDDACELGVRVYVCVNSGSIRVTNVNNVVQWKLLCSCLNAVISLFGFA